MKKFTILLRSIENANGGGEGRKNVSMRFEPQTSDIEIPKEWELDNNFPVLS